MLVQLLKVFYLYISISRAQCVCVGLSLCFCVCFQAGRKTQWSLTQCLMRADTPGAGAVLIFCQCLPKVQKCADLDIHIVVKTIKTCNWIFQVPQEIMFIPTLTQQRRRTLLPQMLPSWTFGCSTKLKYDKKEYTFLTLKIKLPFKPLKIKDMFISYYIFVLFVPVILWVCKI